MRDQPLLVTFWGGPGIGKSTAAARMFAELKMRGVSVELVTEYAKDLVWAERYSCLAHQPSVAAEQMRRLDVLTGQVDVIVTDTSPLLGFIYGGHRVTPAMRAWIADDWKRRDTFNVLLTRDDSLKYQQEGRNCDAHGARIADLNIRDLVQEHDCADHLREFKSTWPGLISHVADCVRGAIAT